MVHGHERVDDYFWLRDRDDPAVTAYLEAENAYADRVLASHEMLRARLIGEMRSRIPERETSPPYRDGDYFYYARFEAGCEYPIYCRKYGSLDASEQVLLDINGLAEGKEYCSVSGFTVSPDHRLAVFGIDTQGRRFYTLRFIDLETGEYLEHAIADVTDNVAWANDGATIFYTRQDRDTLRDHQVRRFSITDGSDSLVSQEDDDTCWLWVEKSLTDRFIYIVSDATLSTEVHYLPADDPLAEPVLFLAREPEHEYYVTDGEDRFYVLSNDGARNFRLLEAPLGQTQRGAWREVVGHRDEVLIEGIDVFARHVVLGVVERGLAQVEVLDRDSGAMHRIEFKEPIYTVCSGDNCIYDTRCFRFVYESLTTPETVYDYDLVARTRWLVWEQAVPGGFDPGRYAAERLLVSVRDGTEVPVSLVYRKGMRKNGRNPLLLSGYGAYGISVEPGFDSDRLSLIDRGFIYAIAHVRGGSELGRGWYEAGRRSDKLNSFNDFIDVTRYLIDKGYTSPEHCYARGGSAGGLLMGAIVNMAPELYHGVATRVPFVDIVTTMLDSSIPLTTGEWDEWGNPADPADYEYMLCYSPYDNVRVAEYPNILVTTGLHDSQVQYWEPAKWVAKLRAHKADDNLLLLKTDLQAGHSGKTGRYRSLDDTALYYTFFLLLEGIEE